MADPEVKLKFAGSAADAERAIANLEKRIQNLENGLKQTSRRMKDAAKDASEMWKSMGDGARELASEITGIRSPLDVVLKGIQLIRREWEDMVERQGAAANANREFARNLQNAANNSDQSLESIEKRILAITTEAKITPQESAKLLNIAQAAKGTLGEDAVDSTIVAAAKVANLDQGAMEGLVGTSLDLQKQVGTTPEKSIGFILAAQAKSRVPHTEEFTKNVLPGIIGVNKLDGTSIEFAAALSAGITQAAGDQTGRTSRTAMTALALQLRDGFPEYQDTEARVRMLQDNPDVMKAFMRGGEVNGVKVKQMQFQVTGPDGEVLSLGTDRASFERKMVPAIEQVLTKGTFAEQMMQASLRDVPTLANSGAEFERRAKDQAANSKITLANRERVGQVNTELTKVLDTAGASDAIDRQMVEDRLKAGGFGESERTFIFRGANARYATRSNVAGTYGTSLAQALEAEKATLETAIRRLPDSATVDTKKQLEVLEKILQELQTNRVEANKPTVKRNGQVEKEGQ